MKVICFPVLAFPLVVSVKASRSAAVVLVDRPLKPPARFTMKPAALDRVRNNVVSLFQPKTLLHVNGVEWRFVREPLTAKGALANTVRAACDFLGCNPNRFEVIARLLDAYPELEPQLTPLVRTKLRDDRVRAAQPLLAALLVAHASSVAHLVEHG